MKTLTLILILSSWNCFAEVHLPKNAVAQEVQTISTYFNKASYFHLKTHEITSMLNEYVWDSYEDEDMNQNLQIILNHDRFETDVNIVGTLKDGVAEKQIAEALYNQSNDAYPMAAKKVSEALKALKREGVIFGFDGNRPYGSVIPSEFILIIDTKNSDIYGLNLY